MPSEYSIEFKEQVIKECQETGNIALVARKHNISSNTIHTWMRKYRKHGTLKPMPNAKDKQSKALEQQLNKVSSENDKLKRLLAEKELEIAILKDLSDEKNPQ